MTDKNSDFQSNKFKSAFNGMKVIFYYLLLLIFIVLISVFLIFSPQESMSMPKMISASVLLAIYVVLVSLVGEGKTIDERARHHRYFANRLSLIAGTAVLSIGVLYQLFSHQLDYWLLWALIAVNGVKIISLIYSDHKK